MTTFRGREACLLAFIYGSQSTLVPFSYNKQNSSFFKSLLHSSWPSQGKRQTLFCRICHSLYTGQKGAQGHRDGAKDLNSISKTSLCWLGEQVIPCRKHLCACCSSRAVYTRLFSHLKGFGDSLATQIPQSTGRSQPLWCNTLVYKKRK